MTRRILVICAGNVCRSPVAAAMLERELPGRTVESAGLTALVGEPAEPLAIELAAMRGLDLRSHRARQVSGEMCHAADLILVMELRHKTALAQRYPLAWGKVFRLGEAGEFDIADPYRQSRPVFEAVCADIARGAAAWAMRIRQSERRLLSRQPVI